MSSLLSNEEKARFARHIILDDVGLEGEKTQTCIRLMRGYRWSRFSALTLS